jgi:hypothetical protein
MNYSVHFRVNYGLKVCNATKPMDSIPAVKTKVWVAADDDTFSGEVIIDSEFGYPDETADVHLYCHPARNDE